MQTRQEWEWDNLVRGRMREIGDGLDATLPWIQLRNTALVLARQELIKAGVIPGQYRTELLASTGMPFNCAG
jgi:hypothetical protein